MAESTAIEWADSTFNPWMGCTALSSACDFCYAEVLMDHRYGKVQWGPHGERVRTSAGNWQNPRRWQRQAPAFLVEHGRRRRVFCASLADVFDNKAPEGALADLWQLIRETPDLDWLLLTKRPQNIGSRLPAFWDEIRDHVWLGVSTENQREAERRLGMLLSLAPRPAVFFASAEPVLGPIDFTFLRQPNDGAGPWWFDALDAERAGWFEDEAATIPTDDWRDHQGCVGRLDWIIAGGESGPNARPTHPDWLRQIRDQCEGTGTAFLFKQWGEWSPVEETVGSHELHALANDGTLYRASELAFPDGARRGEAARADHHAARLSSIYRVGKKAAGRTLDGVTHDSFPEASR